MTRNFVGIDPDLEIDGRNKKHWSNFGSKMNLGLKRVLIIGVLRERRRRVFF